MLTIIPRSLRPILGALGWALIFAILMGPDQNHPIFAVLFLVALCLAAIFAFLLLAHAMSKGPQGP